VDSAVAVKTGSHEGGFVAQEPAPTGFVVNLGRIITAALAQWMILEILPPRLAIFLEKLMLAFAYSS
jgi:hypothetical protein